MSAKLVAMAVSAFLTAVGGTFYAQYFTFIDPGLVFGPVGVGRDPAPSDRGRRRGRCRARSSDPSSSRPFRGRRAR